MIYHFNHLRIFTCTESVVVFYAQNYSAFLKLRDHRYQYPADIIKLRCKTDSVCNDAKNASTYFMPEVFAQVIPELVPCIGYEQHSRFHSLTLYEHLVAAVEACPKDEGIRLAMLLHDVGKPLTQSSDDKGEWHFYGHAEKSAEFAVAALDRFHPSNALKERVREIIRFHGTELKEDDRSIRRRLAKHGLELFRDIVNAHIADDSAKQEFAKERIPQWRAILRRAEQIFAETPCLDKLSLLL